MTEIACVICDIVFCPVFRAKRKITCSPACAKTRGAALRRKREGYGRGRECRECGCLYCPLGHEWFAVCSPACRRGRDVRRQRDWRREESLDPARRNAVNEQQRRRRKENPEAFRAIDRRREAIRRNDPEQIKKLRESRNRYWRATREARLAKRAARLAAMPLERLEKMREAAKRRGKQYRKKRWAGDPEYREKQNQLVREWKRRKHAGVAAMEVSAIGQALERKITDGADRKT